MRVYLPSGKVIGEIHEGTLYRTFRGSLHILKHPCPALAIDARVYDKYRPYFYELCWTDSETGKQYCISAKRFDALRFELNRGYGTQYAVALRWWLCLDPNAKQEQLSLAL